MSPIGAERNVVCAEANAHRAAPAARHLRKGFSVSTIRNWFHIRKQSEEGATAVEYGVMVALIIAVIVAIVLLLGQQVREGFCDTSEALESGGITGTSTLETDC